MESGAAPFSETSRRSPAARLDRVARRPAFAALLAAICGLGLAAAGVTLVRAADDTGLFEVIRSDYLRRMAQSYRLPRSDGYGPYRDAYAEPAAAPRRTATARRTVRRSARVGFAEANARISARLTLCVRTCDGYAFPVGTLARQADVKAHEAACAAACPGAETALYTLMPGQSRDDPTKAVSVRDGGPYTRLATASLFRTKRIASCSCTGPGNVARRLPIALDPTLRTGDVVVDPKGDAKVYAGTGRLPHPPRAFADVRGSRVLGRTASAEIDRLMGISQREAALRAYQRGLRTREASLRGTTFAEVKAPAGSGTGIRAFQVRTDAGRPDASGARIIVIR